MTDAKVVALERLIDRISIINFMNPADASFIAQQLNIIDDKNLYGYRRSMDNGFFEVARMPRDADNIITEFELDMTFATDYSAYQVAMMFAMQNAFYDFFVRAKDDGTYVIVRSLKPEFRELLRRVKEERYGESEEFD